MKVAADIVQDLERVVVSFRFTFSSSLSFVLVDFLQIFAEHTVIDSSFQVSTFTFPLFLTSI